MGYYNGSGVVASGGSNVSVYEYFIFFGPHNVYQQIDAEVTRKSGVSLATARGTKSSISMSDHRFTWDSGNKWKISTNCKGTRRNVSFSQLNGSNLYELQISNETIKARLDNGEWVS